MRCGVELINFVIIAMFCIAVLIFLINVKNHDLMIKIVATAQDVNENNAEIIKHNKSLIEALEQKSE